MITLQFVLFTSTDMFPQSAFKEESKKNPNYGKIDGIKPEEWWASVSLLCLMLSNNCPCLSIYPKIPFRNPKPWVQTPATADIV